MSSLAALNSDQLNLVETQMLRERKETLKPSSQRKDGALPEGYTLRPGRMDDLGATVALFNACSMELIGAEDERVEDVRNYWQTPGFDLERDARVVLAPDGQIVGWMEVWDPAPHVRLYGWGRVHPDHTGRGIGSYLLRWVEKRARQSIPKAPEGARVVLFNGSISTDSAAQACFRQAGLRLVRHHWRMTIEMADDRPPPAPQWPPGITVRTLRVGRDERAVIQAVREAFKDHWGYVERPFEEEFAQWTHFMDNDEDFDPSLWFLAMDGDEIAGVSLCRLKINEDPDMGWVGTLGVRRPWRRKGLGLALLHHSFGELYRRGQRKVGLGVDAESLTGATRLYEKAGMQVARQYSSYEQELRPGEELGTQTVEP